MKRIIFIIGIMITAFMANAQNYDTHTVHWGDGTHTTVTTIGNNTYVHNGNDRQDYIDNQAWSISQQDLYNVENNKKCLKFEKTRVYYRKKYIEEIKSSESVDMGGYTKVSPVKTYKYYIEEWVYEGTGYLINPMENFTPDSVYVTSHEDYSRYDNAANAEMVLHDGVLNVHILDPVYQTCGIYYCVLNEFNYGIYGSTFRNRDDVIYAIGVYGFYAGTHPFWGKEYDSYDCRFGMKDPVLKSHTVKEVDKDTYNSFSDYMFTDKETVGRMHYNEKLYKSKKPREFYRTTKPKNDGFVKYPNNQMSFDLYMDSVKIGSTYIKDPTCGGLMKADTIAMPKKGVKYVIYFRGRQVGTAVVESMPERYLITTPGKLVVKFDTDFNFTFEPMYYKLVKEEYAELYKDHGKLSRKRMEKKYGNDYFTKWMHCSTDMDYILWKK